MKTYSVKEIRKYTGLTRKQLFSYETSIPPVERRDNAGENHRGYKIYDQEGLEKLSLAALFAELGAGPRRINELFSKESFDQKKVIETLVEEAKKEKARLEDIITVAEYFSILDLEKISFNLFQVSDLHSTAELIRRHYESEYVKGILENTNEEKIDMLLDIYMDFAKYEDEEINHDELDKDIEKLIAFAENELKTSNPARFLSGLLESLLGSPEVKRVVDSQTQEGMSDIVADCIAEYQYMHFFDEFELLFDDETVDVFINKDFESPKGKEATDNLLKLINKWFGLVQYDEIINALSGMEIIMEQGDMDEESKIIRLMIEAIEAKQNRQNEL